VGVLLALQDDAGPGAAPSLAEALRVVGAAAQQRALVAVISDFRGRLDWDRSLLDLAGRHDILAVEVRDPREQELPDIGEIWLTDPETGDRLRVDTRDQRLRERFAGAAADERAAVADTLTRAGAVHVVLSTESDWLRSLASGLQRRRR